MAPRGWLKNLALLAGSLLVVAALLEGGARLLSGGTRGIGQSVLPIAFVPAKDSPALPAALPDGKGGDLHTIHLPDQWVWWKVKPGLKDYAVSIGWDAAHGFLLNTDAQGFRLTGTEAPAPARRILVVGDSTTFGVGVDDAETWPAQLEALLAAAGGGPVDVVNAGVPGYSSFQSVRMAEKYGLDPTPALVIVCAGFNDTAPAPAGELPDLERAAKNEREHAAGQAASAFLALLTRAVEGAKQLAPGEQRPRLSSDDYREFLATSEELFRAKGIPVVWMRWPTQDEVATGQPAGAGYPELLLKHAAESGVRSVDLMPVFKGMEKSPYYDFVHANEQGNAAAAQAVAAYLSTFSW